MPVARKRKAIEAEYDRYQEELVAQLRAAGAEGDETNFTGEGVWRLSQLITQRIRLSEEERIALLIDELTEHRMLLPQRAAALALAQCDQQTLSRCTIAAVNNQIFEMMGLVESDIERHSRAEWRLRRMANEPKAESLESLPFEANHSMS